MTSIRKLGWPTCWPASPSTQLIGSTISCPETASSRSTRHCDLGRSLTRLHHHLRRRTAWRGRGPAPRTVNRHVPGRRLPATLPRQGRRCNRFHRGWHRELETDYRRHASRPPRASPRPFSGVSIPRCSPEAYSIASVSASEAQPVGPPSVPPDQHAQGRWPADPRERQAQSTSRLARNKPSSAPARQTGEFG
jgi:hypothetical protein